jgi:hypothetical protein
LKNPELTTLLMVTLINAEGKLMVQTIWATTKDRRYGPRITRHEDVTDAAHMLRRLGELLPALTWQPRAVDTR